MHRLNKNQVGFTIIELMIATAVFSTMLLIITGTMIRIGNLYYKGINQARVQDAVRTITDDVTAQLQLASTTKACQVTSCATVTNPQAYCVGSIRYTYVIKKQLTSDIADSSTQSQHVLWRDDNPDPAGTCKPVPGFPASPEAGHNGSELMAPNASLTEFSINPPDSSPFTVNIGAAYGGTDLWIANGINSRCKGELGDQFCATAHLTTTVTRRLPS